MSCQTHTWISTGRVENHTLGGVPDLFKYGHRSVAYLRCVTCDQIGFRRPPYAVVYTWEQE
jgi:hypothetical protein